MGKVLWERRKASLYVSHCEKYVLIDELDPEGCRVGRSTPLFTCVDLNYGYIAYEMGIKAAKGFAKRCASAPKSSTLRNLPPHVKLALVRNCIALERFVCDDDGKVRVEALKQSGLL